MGKLIKGVALIVALATCTGLALLAFGVLPYKVYAVRTGSMTPTIPSRSAVVVHPHVYRTGQVITFSNGSSIVTHRLVAINADGTITTKGDGNRTVDPWHPPVSAIVGGVVAAPRMAGYWLTYLANPVGLSSLFFGVLCIWQIWALAGIVDRSGVDAEMASPATVAA